MTHHQIIIDREETEAFVEWLPDLDEGQCYYLELFCRRKYDLTMPNSKTYNLNRRIIEKKSQILPTLRKFEVPIGAYRLRDHEVSQESLAIYINTNPRDMKKASFKLMQEILRAVELGNPLRPHSMALTEIHRAKAKTNIITWDVDRKGPRVNEAINYIAGLLESPALSVLETRGGYHFMVQPRHIPADVHKWYEAISSALDYDQRGDIMSPVPGCVQGPVDFTPRFLVRDNVDLRVD